MKRLVSLTVMVAAVAWIATSLASASPSAVDCSNGFVGQLNVPGDLIVPAGSSCGLTQGSTVGHDVIVQTGASFFPGGTVIGHDVKANGAALIELGDVNNGTTQTVVKRDVIIKGQGAAPYGNFICQTRIGHNLTIENSQHAASEWDVGYPDPYNCGRNAHPGVKVGHNATFTHNANSLEVGDLKVGRVLTYTHNRGPSNTLYVTTSGRGCKASHNKAYSGKSNRVVHGHNTCNK